MAEPNQEQPLTDTHCHLNFNNFHKDREDVIAAARQAGLLRILNPGIDLASSREALSLAETYSDVYAAVGVHPNDALTWDEHTLDDLTDLAGHPKAVAIGEIGLDYYRNRSPHDVQQKIFQMQLDLAARLGLPVIVHNREASQDVLSILTDWQVGLEASGSALSSRPGVLHSFSGDVADARKALQAHFCIGITGPVTFKNAPELQKLVASLPLESLLIETDAPFLTPHPLRGKRNEPAYVRFVAEKIAELQGRDLGEVARQTTSNAERLFMWRVFV